MASVGEVVGRNVRELRERTGWTQDRLARAIAAEGVQLSRSAVAWLELGRREDVTLSEALAIAAALRVSVERLLDTAAPGVSLGERMVPGSALKQLLHGQSTVEAPSGDLMAMSRSVHAPRRTAGAIGEAEWTPILIREPDETERTVATRLGVTPDKVREMSLELWGRPIAEERDHRSEVFAGVPTSVAMQKAHVTRNLQKELAEALAQERVIPGS